MREIMERQPDIPGEPKRPMLNLANCACLTHCRLWQETLGGKFPPSAHAPSCEHYKPEEFAVVEYDGSRCVMECSEAQAFLADSEEEYIVTTVMLTRDQFDAMPEFGGF